MDYVKFISLKLVRIILSCLAIVYTLEDDKENAEKYSHIALTSGETPERLKNAIDHYKASHIRN